MKIKKSNKESSSQLFNRYVWLVDIIYRKGRITFEEINEYWQRSHLNFNCEEIPLRTFHNHRKAIEEMFDINIECNKKDGYKYYIENAEDMEKGGARSWFLNAFAVNNLINESHTLKERILFEKIPSGQMHLTSFIEAMRDNLAVEITYQSFWKDTPHTFEIYPYCIRVFKKRWYVIAYSPYKEEVFIYALDRVKQLRVTENSFKLSGDFNAEVYFTDCFGIIADDKVKAETVKLLVYKPQDKYLRALPLHHSQRETENNQETIVFSYYIKPTYDFLQEILSHAADIEVLSPEWFRNEVAEIVRCQHKTYWE